MSRGGEGFYIDEHGRKADALIHEPILAGIDPTDDLAHRIETANRVIKKHGIPPEQAAKLYQVPLKALKSD